MYEKFGNHETLLINLPLVSRGNSKVLKRFKDLAQNSNVQYYHHWTLGLLKLFHYSISKKFIDRSYFFTVREHAENGNVYFLWTEVLCQLFKQAILFFETGNPREIPTLEPIELLLTMDVSVLETEFKRLNFEKSLMSYIAVTHAAKEPLTPEEKLFYLNECRSSLHFLFQKKDMRNFCNKVISKVNNITRIYRNAFKSIIKKSKSYVRMVK